MRGKTKVATRFNKFRTDMIAKFNSRSMQLNDFMYFLETQTNMDQTIKSYCDESETLQHLKSGPPTAIYQAMRLINKPVLLRDLEVLGELIWGAGKKGKNTVYTALSVLYSVNLIDYTFRDFVSTPSNVLQFVVKEEA